MVCNYGSPMAADCEAVASALALATFISIMTQLAKQQVCCHQTPCKRCAVGDQTDGSSLVDQHDGLDRSDVYTVYIVELLGLRRDEI